MKILKHKKIKKGIKQLQSKAKAWNIPFTIKRGELRIQGPKGGYYARYIGKGSENKYRLRAIAYFDDALCVIKYWRDGTLSGPNTENK